MFVFMTTAYDANLGPIFTGFCNVPLAATFSTPALPVRKEGQQDLGVRKADFSQSLKMYQSESKRMQCEFEICSYNVLEGVLCVGVF